MRTLTVGELRDRLNDLLRDSEVDLGTPIIIGGVGHAWLIGTNIIHGPNKVGYTDDRKVADSMRALVLVREP